VAIITLDAPRTRNALTPRMPCMLCDAFKAFAALDTARRVADHAPLAVRAIKRTVDESSGRPWPKAVPSKMGRGARCLRPKTRARDRGPSWKSAHRNSRAVESSGSGPKQRSTTQNKESR
jgi:enoyl-CoA hydratase/carnithine racemase